MHTTYKYNFWGNGGDSLGSLFLENDESAKKVAKMSFAVLFENAHTKQVYKRCPGCGEWFKAEILTNGLCCGCYELQKIQDFINYLDGELAQADGNGTLEELYKEHFALSFKGETLILEFGAIEFNNIFACLETIIKERKE